MTSLTVSPGQVNVNSQAAVVTFAAHLTDDNSGIATAIVDFSNGSHTLSFFLTANELYSGNATDGIYHLSFTVPRYEVGGTYHLSMLRVSDGAGNSRTYDHEATPDAPNDLSHLGFSPSLVVISSTSDVTPPMITSLTATPSAVNVDGHYGMVLITAHIVDDLSGVASFHIQFSNGEGSDSQGYGTGGDASSRISGTASDGVYQVQLPIPAYAAGGTYMPEFITLVDRAQNEEDYMRQTSPLDPAYIDNSGVRCSFFVTSTTPDTAPPVVTSLMGSPASVNVNQGPAIVTLTVHATDDISGVYAVDLGFSNGVETLICNSTGHEPISGTPNDGTYQFTLTVPQHQAVGTYHISSLEAYDEKVNYTTFAASSHPDLFAFSFVVTDQAPSPTPVPSSTPFPSPAATPAKRPTATVRGNKVVNTVGAKFSLRGVAAGGVTSLSYRSGNGAWVTIPASSTWKIAVRVRRGRNVFTVIAHGPGGDSVPLKITVIRK